MNLRNPRTKPIRAFVELCGLSHSDPISKFWLVLTILTIEHKSTFRRNSNPGCVQCPVVTQLGDHSPWYWNLCKCIDHQKGWFFNCPAPPCSAPKWKNANEPTRKGKGGKYLEKENVTISGRTRLNSATYNDLDWCITNKANQSFKLVGRKSLWNMKLECTWHVGPNYGPCNNEVKKKGESDIGKKIFWEDSDWAAK